MCETSQRSLLAANLVQYTLDLFQKAFQAEESELTLELADFYQKVSEDHEGVLQKLDALMIE